MAERGRAAAVRGGGGSVSEAAASRLRILSVEDELLNRVLLRAVLERSEDARLREADLSEATTVSEGRQRLRESVPDLVLLDRRLPDGDGLDLAREVPPAPTAPRPLFVAVTADAVPATRDAAAAAGCDAVVIKPYMPTELTAVLTRLLDGRVPPAPAPPR